jgi:hypothetical protein
MKKLLIELMNWFQLTGYRKASYDRLLGILENAQNYNEMNDLVAEYPNYFRSTTMKGGFPGLALLESVYPYRVLEAEGASNTVAEAPLLVLPESPTQPTAEVLNPQPRFETPSLISLNPNPVPTLVQPTAMEAEIKDEYFRNLGSALKTPDGPAANVTLCVLILRNGFVIVGKSACVDRANFNEETGKRLAREDAIKQIMPYLGWRLADARMFAAEDASAPDYRFG